LFVDARVARRSEVPPNLAAIVVLGMHRSGTSSLAGALVRLGGAAPTHLMDPAPTNVRGFFESPVIMALNDDVLAAADSHWADWRRFSRSRIDARAEKALRSRALSALATEYGTSGVPVLKDPRLCRMMDFWTPVFEAAGWSTRFVIPIRSPFEVALSLQRRDGFPLSVGCLLWLRHVLDAEADSRGASRAIVDWSRFLADWRGELDQISARLRTSWPSASPQAFESVGTFLSPDLRNFEANAEDLSVDPAICRFVRDVHSAMLRVADDPDDVAVLTRLDSLRAKFDAVATLFDSVGRDLEHETARLKRQIKEEREQRDAAQARLVRAEQLVAALTQAHADRNAAPRHALDLRRHRRSEAPVERIRNSALFAADRYLEANPDVRAAGWDPAEHYLAHGAAEGRDPGPHFSTRAYLAGNPDVAAAGINPLVHYESRGRQEGRAALG
jgi:hypothetical protein